MADGSITGLTCSPGDGAVSTFYGRSVIMPRGIFKGSSVKVA